MTRTNVCRARPILRVWRWPFALAAALLCVRSSLAAEDILDAYTEPYQVIRLAAPEAGLLQQFHVRPGQSIQAGQVVAELDCSVLAAELAAAKTRAAADGRRQAAAAELALRKSRLKKLQQLQTEQSATPEELQRAEADFAVAAANLQTASDDAAIAASQVNTIAAQLERRKICSPIQGAVSMLHKEPGEFVGVTAPEVATIVRLDVLKVKLHLPEKVADGLRVDQTVELSLPGSSGRAAARVEFVAPFTDPDTRTVRVELRIENADLKVRAGERCRMTGHSTPVSRTAPDAAQR